MGNLLSWESIYVPCTRCVGNLFLRFSQLGVIDDGCRRRTRPLGFSLRLLLPLSLRPTMGFDFEKTFGGVKLDGKVVFITGATYDYLFPLPKIPPCTPILTENIRLDQDSDSKRPRHSSSSAQPST